MLEYLQFLAYITMSAAVASIGVALVLPERRPHERPPHVKDKMQGRNKR